MSARASRIAPLLRQDFRFDVAPPVTDWCEANLIIPRKFSPAFPGPYRSSRQPTSRPILECWHPASGVRSCINVAGSQTAKTFESMLGLGYRIRYQPMPVLLMGPSEDWLRLEISEKRLQPLIDENPALACMKPFDGSKYRKLAMDLAGGTIAIEGANSPVATAGSTQGIVMIAEAAKIEHQSREDAPEAHPIKLAFERTKAFRGLEFHWMDFTPNRVESIPWQMYLEGTQTHFYLQCPHCSGDPFPLEFELKRKENEDLETALADSQHEARPSVYRSLVWNADARATDGSWNEARIRETTHYICPRNGCEISEEHRLTMIANFVTVDHNKQASQARRSFRRPSFYSPTVTFADMALEFLKRGDLFTTGLQNFYNSWLALPWEKVTANVNDSHVRALRDLASYRRAIIPHRPYRLVITADVGDYRTHWEVAAHMPDEEIFIIDWGTVTAVEDLIALPQQLRYQLAGTEEYFSPDQGLVDARDQTVRVYDMCQQTRGVWFPASGSDARVGTWTYTPLKTHQLDLYTFNTHQLKLELYRNLILKQAAPRLYMPADATEDLILGHSGQQLVRAPNGGEQWKKVAGDHYGDCTLRQLLARLIHRNWRGVASPDLQGATPSEDRS